MSEEAKVEENNEEIRVLPTKSNMHATPARVFSIDDIEFTDALLEKAQHMIKTGLLPDHITLPQQVVVIAAFGKELGFPFMASLNNVIVINGKPSLVAKATQALILKNGITYKTIKDMSPIYKGDGTDAVIDYETVILFRREVNGVIMEEPSRFTWLEASAADLLKKDVWKKYLKRMMWWRAFTMGADRIGSDILLGLSDAATMADVHNINYNMDEEGKVTIIQPTAKK